MGAFEVNPFQVEPPAVVTLTVMSVAASGTDMENLRQKLISLFFVLLMLGSGIAYSISFF